MAAARNDPCPCGSGRRYKHCHGQDTAPARPIAKDARELTAAALAAHQRGDVVAAERGYRAALAAGADEPVPLHYLAMLQHQRGEHHEAWAMVERSLALRPDDPEFRNNAGMVLAALGRSDDAIAAYRRAIELRPSHKSAWHNLGLVMTAHNRVVEAEAAQRAALHIDPAYAVARWDLAIALLLQGKLREGFAAFEVRRSMPQLSRGELRAQGPCWAGEPLTGRTLLLTAEQGLGDTLQFIRFAQPLAAAGARVIAQVPAALCGLCAGVPGVAAAVPVDQPIPAHDFQLPLLSAAFALDVDVDALATPGPYLHADAARVARLAPLLDPSPQRLHVGLSWAGRAQHANDHARSCPLAALAPLFKLDGITWYSLQHGDGEDQVAQVPAAAALVELDDRHDFDDKAALVASLDLVISVDTVHAHLAGALGVPVWIMLPFAPDWRWQLDRSDSPWYPTARLFRQPSAGDWPAVVDQLCGELTMRTSRPDRPPS